MAKPVCKHLHIYCCNLEEMISFWVDVFGASLIKRRKFGADEGAVLDLGLGTELYLKATACEREDSGPQRSGIDHFGMLVDDLDAFLKKFVGTRGITLLREPFMSEKVRCAFISGPEGTRVEVMEETA